jgi:hypothetical protein
MAGAYICIKKEKQKHSPGTHKVSSSWPEGNELNTKQPKHKRAPAHRSEETENKNPKQKKKKKLQAVVRCSRN